MAAGSSVRSWWRGVRPVNLLMVLITQTLVWLMIEDYLLCEGNWLLRGIVTASTLLICAGGNLINDWYDQKIDGINKPDAVWVGKLVDAALVRRVAMAMLILGSVAGVLSGLWSGQLAGSLFIPLAAGMLVQYSKVWQHRWAWGNLTVAFLIGLTVLLPLLTDPALYVEMSARQACFPQFSIFSLLRTIVHFAGLAFVATLFRELAKDVEDIAGDRAFGGETLGMRLGASGARWVLLAYLLAELLIALSLAFWRLCSQVLPTPSLVMFSLTVLLILVLAVLVIRTTDETEFGRISLGAKLLQACGLLWMFVLLLTPSY